MKPLFFLAASALAAPALILAGCQPKTPENSQKVVIEAVKKEAKTQRDEFSGLRSAELSDGGELSGGDAQGRPLWKVSARKIAAAMQPNGGATKTATLLDARATLYNAGKPESSLKAPQIVIFYLKNGVRLALSKGVTGTTQGVWTKNRGAVQLAAPRADVDVAKRVLQASGGVKMSQGAVKVSAQTLRARTSLQSAQLNGDVRAQNAQGKRLEAESALYNWQTNRVLAQTVSAIQGQTRLSGDVLNADTDANGGTLTGRVRARSPQGQASAPRLDFNWKRDEIRANDATFTGPQGSARAASLVTDSKLRLASAQKLVIEGQGATLRAASASGFDGLSRLTARDLDYKRADTRFSAPSGTARKVGTKWVLEAQNGARGQNSDGKISAPRLIWDEGRARVEASGGVTLEKAGATLRGQKLTSDTKFESAILSGQVRGQLADGSVLTAQTLEKRGEKFLARNGATARLKPRGAIGVLTLSGAQIEAKADGSSAVATGGVTLTSSTGATARAPRATYDRARDTVTASGGVDFSDPSRGIRTRSDTLVYNLKTGQATLPNTSGRGDLKLFEGKKLFP